MWSFEICLSLPYLFCTMARNCDADADKASVFLSFLYNSIGRTQRDFHTLEISSQVFASSASF
jgi:hypothetical protein